MENLEMAFTLLLAGFIIVFIVLILLIAVITLYGKIIQSVQNAALNKIRKNDNIPVAEKPAVRVVASENSEKSDEIPGEIIAVIAAAVDAVYGNKPHKIRNVKRSCVIRSSWGNAGIAENTRPF